MDSEIRHFTPSSIEHGFPVSRPSMGLMHDKEDRREVRPCIKYNVCWRSRYLCQEVVRLGITYLVTGPAHVLVAEATVVSPRMMIQAS
ncbi:hypothetical protein E2C01_058858 [Portunus trituberculatus]|uniref:Uncharacterized protein n=1 Tax=Portunus trituberculatus TaxID=210409 RepID=A0A5B7H6S9_PORTR|nr:hypothetical protein [Portunus trituberculatus]